MERSTSSRLHTCLVQFHYAETIVPQGVHEAEQNLISLHTLPGCTMPEKRYQTGCVLSLTIRLALATDWTIRRTTISTNCDTSFNFNQGCGTQVRGSGSYGRDFNSGRGGFYALARSKEYGIKVWFWPRVSFVPVDVRENLEGVDPDLWGPPTAYFPTGENCGYEEHFNDHMLIFDLTFCVRSFPHRVS